MVLCVLQLCRDIHSVSMRASASEKKGDFFVLY